MSKLARALLLPFIALLAILLLLALTSDSPATTIAVFFTVTFSSAWQTGNMLNMAGMLILAAGGSALAMRSGTFNLGGEAQLYAPALVTAIILTAPVASTLPVPLTLTLALAAALITGAVIGFIPGLFRALNGTSEMLTSFLLSGAIVPVIDYLISGPWRDQGRNLLATPAIAAPFRLKALLPPSFFNLSFFIAAALTLAAALLVERTRAGYHIRISGVAPGFAEYAGLRVKTVRIFGMTAAGTLHALAGFFAITGTWYMCHLGITAGLGWSALAIALIARGNLLAVLPAGLFYAWLDASLTGALQTGRYSFNASALVQAVIFLSIAARAFPGLKIRRPA